MRGSGTKIVVEERKAQDAEDAPDVSTSTEPDRASDVAVGPGRADNRNEEVDASPVPDPTADDTGADDIPEAD